MRESFRIIGDTVFPKTRTKIKFENNKMMMKTRGLINTKLSELLQCNSSTNLKS